MADHGDGYWLRAAVEEGRKCAPAAGAFSVGAVVVRDGVELARGHSRETDPTAHAEEVALAKLAGTDLTGATVYSSLEPCSARRSRPRTCTQLIIASGARRVVFAWREPAVFVDCHGAEQLTAAGVEVVELPALADAVRDVNRHLLDTSTRPPDRATRR